MSASVFEMAYAFLNLPRWVELPVVMLILIVAAVAIMALQVRKVRVFRADLRERRVAVGTDSENRRPP